MNKSKKQTHQDFVAIEPFAVTGFPQNMTYKVDIDDTFDHPRQFAEIVDTLDNAADGDYMCINLTTDGGALHSILPLLGAIENTQCHVHIHAMSDVASAGTFLLMKAHSVSVNDYVTIMCHQVSFGSAGAGNTVATHVAHTMKSSERLIRDIYMDFFNSQEIDKMLSGSDYYMDKTEFIARCELRSQIAQEKHEAMMAEKQTSQVSKPKRKPVKKESFTDMAIS